MYFPPPPPLDKDALYVIGLGDGTYADFCDSLDNCLMRFNDSAANPSHTVYVRKVAPTKENHTGWQCQVILTTKEFPALFEMTF